MYLSFTSSCLPILNCYCFQNTKSKTPNNFQVPMNLFIMYMSGNAISIFPIMMVIMMAVRPVKTLFSINSTFKSFDANESTFANFGQKIVYVLGNLVGIALAVYKCQSMGLLPTHASDWLAFADPVLRAEWAYA